MMFPSQNKITFDLNTRNASHWPRAFLDAGIGATRRPNEELINKWSGLRQIEAELFFSWRSTGTCNFFAVTDSSLHCGPPAAPGHLDIFEIRLILRAASCTFFRTGIRIRAHQVNRNVRLVAHHPAVMPRRDVKHVSTFISNTRPSSIAAVARPEITIPTCSTAQLFAPAARPTCSDHFHPGS